jgi:hypothetical protein
MNFFQDISFATVSVDKFGCSVVTLAPEHGAESSKNRALSKKPKGRRLLPNLLEPGQPRASRKR